MIGGIQMRRFLYYNQDTINSFLAQIEQGLMLKQEKGEEHTGSASSTQETQTNITSDISAKVLGIGASLQGDIRGLDSDTEIASKMVKNIQEKVLHDYAFDKVHEYIIKHDMINNEAPQIGDIVLVEEQPTLLDFNYLQGLFTDGGIVKFGNEQSKKKLAEMRQSIPKGNKVPESVKSQIKVEEDKIKSAEQERVETAKTLEAIRNAVPYNRFLMTDCMLVPLEDKNFRDDPQIVAFKYGGTMSILGYVTNIIDDENRAEYNNDFAPLYNILNNAMLSFFKNKQKIYIVHPIALYY